MEPTKKSMVEIKDGVISKNETIDIDDTNFFLN